MKKFVLLLIVLLTVSLFAQTKSGCATMSPEKLAQAQSASDSITIQKPSPSVSKWTRWEITPTVSVQYDPTVWKLGKMDGPDGPSVLFPLGKDGKPRFNIALSATVIESTLDAANIIAMRVAKTEDEKSVTRIALREYQAGEEYGVLFAYTVTDTIDGIDYVVGRWSFAGDKLDTKSHIVIEFEGVISMLEGNDDVMEKMDDVIQTYQIKGLVPNKPVPLPKK